MSKLFILAIIGVVLSIGLGIYTEDPWCMLWFLFSVALGNITAKEEQKRADEANKAELEKPLPPDPPKFPTRTEIFKLIYPTSSAHYFGADQNSYLYQRAEQIADEIVKTYK